MIEQFSEQNLLNVENSMFNKKDIPSHFKKNELFNSCEKFTASYSNFDIELIFQGNNFSKKVIKNTDSSLFVRDYNFIEIEYRANKLYSFDMNYGDYHLRSIYSYKAFSQERVMSKNIHYFQTDLLNQKIWQGLQIIGDYDILKIYNNKDWLISFNHFLLKFEQDELYDSLCRFIQEIEPDFLNPNDELFYLIDFNFSEY
jgi:hypothetical protein